jgi:ribosome maturation factor RimP
MLNKNYIEGLLSKALEGTTAFIVDINLLPDSKVNVFIDKPEGIVVADCVKINRLLANNLEAEGINADITVSSPGLEEPFKVNKQYIKNIGRKVKVLTRSGEEKMGKLVSANSEGIKIETTETIKNGNKKEYISRHYQFIYSELAKTQIVISFK